MWSSVVVILNPFFCKYLYLLCIFKEVGIKDTFPKCTVDTFNVTVLHQPAWLNVLYLYLCQQDKLDLLGALEIPMWLMLPVVLRKPLEISRTESADERWQKSILTKCVQLLIPLWCLSDWYC